MAYEARLLVLRSSSARINDLIVVVVSLVQSYLDCTLHVVLLQYNCLQHSSVSTLKKSYLMILGNPFKA